MDMHHDDHPPGDYRVVNRAEVLDPPRAIGWLTLPEGRRQAGVRRLDPALRPRIVRAFRDRCWSAVPRFFREHVIQFPPFGQERLLKSSQHPGEPTAAAFPVHTDPPIHRRRPFSRPWRAWSVPPITL